MEINKITDYISDEEKFLELAKKIYEITSGLDEIYPDYEKWFYEKQVKESILGKRDIIFIIEQQEIIAISSVKKTNEEKKICTLYVKDEYRNKGIGSILLEESFKYLETDKPLITFCDSMISIYTEFINKYNWELQEILEDYYETGKSEYCYNGKLKNKQKV